MLEWILLASLQGGVEFNVGHSHLKLETPKLSPVVKTQPKEIYIDIHISAIGMRFSPDDNTVLEIDPASDLYGIVCAGDTILSIAGTPPAQSVYNLASFGNVDTIVDVEVDTKATGYQLIHCRRKPIERFQPVMSKEIAKYLRP